MRILNFSRRGLTGLLRERGFLLLEYVAHLILLLEHVVQALY